ncbi:MAG: type II secretion system protein [Burkholderiales bacterium]|nr:type II secretion system protein [Burkholderiales bacterium]
MPRTERVLARQHGFTLIEAVMVIAITGVVIAMVSIFIVPATTAYFASSARAQLGDQADTALRRIARDLALALPNSARVSPSGLSLELIPVSGAARYATDSGNPLQFGVIDAGFDIIGPALKLSHASQQLAWYNLGAGIPDADAYTLSNVRTSTSAAGNATTVSITGAALPNALMAPPYRVYAIEPPVSYRCDLTARTLTRYSGYGFVATQPDPPSGGTGAVLARNVSACTFSFNAGAVAARYGLVTLQISLSSSQNVSLSDGGETVSLYQAVHVDNLP